MKRHYMIPAPRKTIPAARVYFNTVVAPDIAISKPAISAEEFARKFQGSTAKVTAKVYTGDSMLGVATMHKSNAVPVFSSESAKDISNMRR